MAESERDDINRLFGMVIDLGIGLLQVKTAVRHIRIIMQYPEADKEIVGKSIDDSLDGADKAIEDLIVKFKNFREPR